MELETCVPDLVRQSTVLLLAFVIVILLANFSFCLGRAGASSRVQRGFVKKDKKGPPGASTSPGNVSEQLLACQRVQRTEPIGLMMSFL